jgi:hypothetical protein
MIFKCNFLNSRNSSNILQLIIISITHQILKIILHLSLTIVFFLILMISIINFILLSFWGIIHSLYLIKRQLSNNLTLLFRFTLYTRVVLRRATFNSRQIIYTFWRWTHFYLIISFF